MPQKNHSRRPLSANPKSFLLIFLGALLFYANTLGHGFVWDDLILIFDNDALRKASNFGAFFTTPFFKLAADINFPHHRPMVAVLIFLTSLFSGVHPFGYHLLNVVLHSIVTWFFYKLLQRVEIEESSRIFATAIFLTHPAHVEVVAWPCCSAVLAGSVFFLAALLFSLKLYEAKTQKAMAIFAVAGLYALGLMSYDLVLILPAIILLWIFLFDKHGKSPINWKLRIKEQFVLGLLALDFLWVRYSLTNQMGGFARFQHGDPNATNILLDGTKWGSLAAIPNVLTRYLEILIFPLNLNPEAYFGCREYQLSALASGFLFFLAIIFTLRSRNVPKRALIFGLAWLGVSLLPVVHIIFQGGLFADRYLYLASMGYALVAALCLQAFWDFLQSRFKNLKPRTAYLLAVLFCVALGAKTSEQNKIWRNDLTFWRAASVMSPQKPRVQYLYGGALLRFGYPLESIEAFNKAIRLSPYYPHPYKGVAFALRELGKNNDADRMDLLADKMYQIQASRAQQKRS